jgi:hypothetical protein
MGIHCISQVFELENIICLQRGVRYGGMGGRAIQVISFILKCFCVDSWCLRSRSRRTARECLTRKSHRRRTEEFFHKIVHNSVRPQEGEDVVEHDSVGFQSL